MPENTPRYADIDLDFLIHPLSGDVVRKFDHEAIKRSIRNLVNLERGDKPFHPEISAGVRRLLFEPASHLTTVRLKQTIERIIKTYEPRVQLERVDVTMDRTESQYFVSVFFTTINRIEPVQFDFALERIR